MSKKQFTAKSIKQRNQDAVNSLPIYDNKAIQDVQMYLSLPIEALNKLPQFTPEGEIAFYQIGDDLMGKVTLLKFIETIKNK